MLLISAMFLLVDPASLLMFLSMTPAITGGYGLKLSFHSVSARDNSSSSYAS